MYKNILEVVLSFEKYFSFEELNEKLIDNNILLNKKDLNERLNIFMHHGIIAKQNTYYKIIWQSSLPI